MNDSVDLIAAMDRRVQRRAERRDFFRSALGAGMVAAGGIAAIGLASPAAAQSAPSDLDILNFALNLEYLEAQFYAFAATGAGLDNSLLTGSVGTRGAVSGGQRANLSDVSVIQYAREIAEDERLHVIALRAALGGSAVAQPAIDISPTVFTAAAVAAGIDLSASGGVFNPYADDNSFLLGAYIFEDVGVTAYKGAAPLISNVDLVDAAAGILAAEAYHAGIIRSALYRRGIATPALWTATDKIAAARDALDGTAVSSGPPQRVASDDAGVTPTGTGTATTANIVPTDSNGLVFSRTTEQVHNIAYLTKAQVTAGGFFPAGTNNANAALRRSAAN